MDTFSHLALEEIVLNGDLEQTVVIMAWRSGNAVIIGRNQNPWVEADRDFLDRHGTVIARRVSGGGAVYQDPGNINFSFIADEREFNIRSQLGIVQGALKRLGIQSEINDRRDILIQGKKCSGSALAYRRGRALHHCSLLVNTDLSMMASLQGSIKVGKFRGIRSLPSEVVNAGSHGNSVSVDTVIEAVRIEAEHVYGRKLHSVGAGEVTGMRLPGDLYEKYCSWEWRFGETPPFEALIQSGCGYVSAVVEKGRVVSATTQSGDMVTLDAPGLPEFSPGIMMNLSMRANGLSNCRI